MAWWWHYSNFTSYSFHHKIHKSFPGCLYMNCNDTLKVSVCDWTVLWQVIFAVLKSFRKPSSCQVAKQITFSNFMQSHFDPARLQHCVGNEYRRFRALIFLTAKISPSERPDVTVASSFLVYIWQMTSAAIGRINGCTLTLWFFNIWS